MTDDLWVTFWVVQISYSLIYYRLIIQCFDSRWLGDRKDIRYGCYIFGNFV